jgi:hypothetical protein
MSFATIRRPAPLILAFALLLVGATCRKNPTGLQGGPHRAGALSVLFIGNSLTYENELPDVVTRIGLQVGDTIDAWSVAFPDYAIIDHIHSGTAITAIKSWEWDYVVLQQGPSTVQINRDSLILWTKMIDPTIRAQGAQTGLFMVWPDASRMAFFDACRVSYQQAAQAVGGVFMPAGAAWQVAWGKDPQLQLYGGDGYHPSELGTYLAALVIYERITGRDARTLPDVAIRAGGGSLNVSASTVQLLQESAHEANATYPAR